MKFWKEHGKLRMILMALFFIVGLFLVIGGWQMTGKLAGLGLMLVGLVLLLTTLLVYNKAFD